MTKELQIDDRLVTLQVGFLVIDIVKNVLMFMCLKCIRVAEQFRGLCICLICLCSGFVDMGYGWSREIPESWSCIL